MKTSKYLLLTLKTNPNNTEIKSHQLMLKSGMIYQLASGLYTWLPTGLRVLQKAKKIIRKEMNKIGALEINMPLIQPACLWEKSGRWTKYGTELLKFKNRNEKSFLLGPTHEEVITDLINKQISSYKELPLNMYQISTKFRDEIRPRYGIIRTREFIMKDGYSFHSNQKSLQQTYEIMYQAYTNIFTTIGLKFFTIQADNGTIGGNISHEFQAITKYNKNHITYSIKSNDPSSNNPIKNTKLISKNSKEIIRLISASKSQNINDLIRKFNVPITKIVKTLIVHAKKNTGFSLIALLIRGDHQLNKKKAEKLPQIAVPLSFANEQEIRLTIGTDPKSLGPINLPIPLIADYNVATMNDFIAGANIDDKYFFGINWHRDLPLPQIADLRKIVHNNHTLNGKKILKTKKNIEIGHIFQLGDKYSNKIKIKDRNNNLLTITMGCYGIGIGRMIAANIEQNHDQQGILWPDILAPFNVAIIPINMHKSTEVKQISENIYHQLSLLKIDVLLDDRKESIGKMFADIELIGIPHIIIISERTLKQNETEYKNRRSGKNQRIKIDTIINYLVKVIT
ncbi:proline--tRNA ligase [Blochmannia endosymbiont of Camponotus (Colobopsis) obliquus]|uniref:proline--tRNA ligase n=1 Tax=Blochmannia endosymbiont of Camponotus (Colobopsis) obliquus TaxID=1505597 RepID=UPI00061A7A2E|nr:proline--tRNA ligase [Blochmannia endosymbiont of Camponotus (Colobopsis) obliquus]AKC60455.1 proline--tRNA ligase [Blochmannia endosymbiont of Camponotus (Colobopsis) obliquus]